MSKRVYLLGVGLALVGLAFLLADWALTPSPGMRGVTALHVQPVIVAPAVVIKDQPPEPADRITFANCERIKPGMGLAQVEALLGRPATVRDPITSGVLIQGEGYMRVQVGWRGVWHGAAGNVTVWFTAKEGVKEVEFTSRYGTSLPDVFGDSLEE